MDILIFRGITLFVCMVVNLLFAFFLWKRKGDKQAFYLGWVALFSAFYAFFCGSTYFFWDIIPDHRLFLYRSTWLGVFILPAYLSFVYYFVQKIKYLKIKSFSLYLGALIIGYLAVTTPYFIEIAYQKNDFIIGEAGSLDFVGRLYIFFCTALGLFYLLREYFRTQDNFRKRQIKYFIVGFSIYITGGIISVSMIPLITGESAYYDVTAYLSIVWVSLTVYAILKYRLFDVRLVMGRLAIYIFCTITFVGISFFLLFLNTLINSLIPVSVILVLMLLLVVSTLSYFFAFFEKIAGRHFYYTFYRLKNAIEKLTKELNQTIELDKLAGLILRSLLDALKLDKVGIILKRPGGDFYAQNLIKIKENDISSILFREKGFLIQYLKNTKEPLVSGEITYIVDGMRKMEKGDKMRIKTEETAAKLLAVKETADMIGISVFMPLFIKEEIVGIIVLGGKLSGEIYTAQDIKLLSVLSSQSAIAFNNALAYKEINQRKADLEKFYRLTVGRELKMAELKKKIERLEER